MLTSQTPPLRREERGQKEKIYRIGLNTCTRTLRLPN